MMLLTIKKLVRGKNGKPDKVVDHGTPKVLAGRDHDQLRHQAKTLATADGSTVRSLSMTVDGNMVAVVTEGHPQAARDPNWVWKRPPSSQP
jgi:hypothetical protein